MDQPVTNGQAQDVLSPAHPSPLSCADIAARLGRNPVSVSRAVKRIALEPEIITPGGYKFYSETSVALIEKAMRKPNKTRIAEADICSLHPASPIPNPASRKP